MLKSLAIILLTVLLFAGCKESKQALPSGEGMAVDAASSVNEFALELYKELASEEGNLFFSPASISTALTMTWAGTGDQTASETAGVLHLDSDRDQVMADFSQLLKGFASSDSTFTLNVANRLWGQKSFSFKPAYISQIENYFGGGFEPMDFANHSNRERQTINQWVADRTENRIQNLLPNGSINGDTRLILTNTVYFLGDWVFPFKTRHTKEENFHTSSGATIKTPTMKLTKNLFHYSDKNLAILALPYKGDDLQFIIILPHDKLGLSKVESSLSLIELQKKMDLLSSREVSVHLPKMDLSQSFKLNNVLQQLGMEKAFAPKTADFSAMTDTDGLFISSVVHKSFLKVDEKGTEAAAATSVNIAVTSMPSQSNPPIHFNADHPFLFMIRQKTTGAILFMGRLENPAK